MRLLAMEILNLFLFVVLTCIIFAYWENVRPMSVPWLWRRTVFNNSWWDNVKYDSLTLNHDILVESGCNKVGLASDTPSALCQCLTQRTYVTSIVAMHTKINVTSNAADYMMSNVTWNGADDIMNLVRPASTLLVIGSGSDLRASFLMCTIGFKPVTLQGIFNANGSGGGSSPWTSNIPVMVVMWNTVSVLTMLFQRVQVIRKNEHWSKDLTLTLVVAVVVLAVTAGMSVVLYDYASAIFYSFSLFALVLVYGALEYMKKSDNKTSNDYFFWIPYTVNLSLSFLIFNASVHRRDISLNMVTIGFAFSAAVATAGANILNAFLRENQIHSQNFDKDGKLTPVASAAPTLIVLCNLGMGMCLWLLSYPTFNPRHVENYRSGSVRFVAGPAAVLMLVSVSLLESSMFSFLNTVMRAAMMAAMSIMDTCRESKSSPDEQSSVTQQAEAVDTGCMPVINDPETMFLLRNFITFTIRIVVTVACVIDVAQDRYNNNLASSAISILPAVLM